MNAYGCDKIYVVPPEHPGSYNWYMPMRTGQGLQEVSVGWRAPAYSLIQAVQLGDKRKLGKCRPKRFLVASGAEYHSHQGKRDYVMRGTSVLPDEKGGRKAFMWLLAVGMPLEGEMVALVGPTLQQNEFEVRGIWLWKRAFRFPDDALMSETDLRRVNLNLVWQGFLFLGWCNLKKLPGGQVQKDRRRPMFVWQFCRHFRKCPGKLKHAQTAHLVKIANSVTSSKA